MRMGVGSMAGKGDSVSLSRRVKGAGGRCRASSTAGKAFADVAVEDQVAPEAEMDMRYARRRGRLGRAFVTVVILILAAWAVKFLVTNQRLEWNVVWKYLFSHQVLKGLLTTILLACVAQAIGTVIGTVLAVFRLSNVLALRLVSAGYVTVIRSVPVLLQIIFWFNLAYLFPRLGLSVPFGPTLFSGSTNSIVTPFIAAVLGLSLMQGAYMTEIIRSGIMSVDRKQRDAAMAMGFTPLASFFRVVLPQAVRIIVPPTGSQFITVIHGSSLVSVIGVGELLFSVQNVYERTYQIVPLLLVAVVWYLAVVLVLSLFQSRVEKRLGRGYSQKASRRSPEQSMRAGGPVLARPKGEVDG